ncbi:cysteine proteinase [Hypomontagnella monticulosa]|nr:cysteine proteinase [Hypomontagnella monticulosa]
MESLETIQSRHRKEQRELQARITNKKKNATKKTRKGVNDECAELERQLKEKQEQEVAALNGDVNNTEDVPNEEGQHRDNSHDQQANGLIPTDATDEIIQQLDGTTLSQPPESDPSTQQQPKKRNRQKERLARRAAEQEAATLAAEKEAANMTDHRKIEKTYLLKEFKANHLVEKEIQPDGHCLFSAVADQLQTRGIPLGSEEGAGKLLPYKIVRKAATDYMEAHPDDFAPFLEEPLDSYVPKIRDTAEWGGQLELSALANAYGVEIKVLQDGRTETIEPSAEGAGKEGEMRQRIWLAYYRHGYGLGEHYNSLRQAA